MPPPTPLLFVPSHAVRPSRGGGGSAPSSPRSIHPVRTTRYGSLLSRGLGEGIEHFRPEHQILSETLPLRSSSQVSIRESTSKHTRSSTHPRNLHPRTWLLDGAYQSQMLLNTQTNYASNSQQQQPTKQHITLLDWSNTSYNSQLLNYHYYPPPSTNILPTISNV